MSGPVYDWIRFNARRAPDHLAAFDLYSNRRFTYGAFADRVDGAANLLLRNGIRKGDRIAVLSRNTTDMFEIQFACMRLGAIFLPLNWRLAGPELEYIVGDAAPAILFAGTGFADKAAAVAATCGVAPVLGLGDGDSASDYESGLAEDADAVPPAELDQDDPWTIIYTSGTTGRPKGATITYGTTFYNLVNIGAFARITLDSACLIVGPLFHIGALCAFGNPCFHVGGTTVVMRDFDPGDVLRVLNDPALAVIHLNGAVTMYTKMSEHPDFDQADLSRIQCATISGEPVPLALVERYLDEKSLPLQNIYGMTETGPVLTAADADIDRSKLASIGTQVLYTEMRLVDRAGHDVVAGEIGEIWARGPNVSPGYWNNPQATRAAFTDGWLRTGDAAWRDEDGFYYLVDRWKDMYISGGENVYPAEVEAVIGQLDDVAEVAVIGVPDSRWGEAGRAVVTLRDSASLGEDSIIAHCSQNLAKFKVPATVVFVEALPRNASGKVVKPEIRRRYGFSAENSSP